jgi:type II restriction enzyme
MPAKSHAHESHLTAAKDLVTPYANTRAGFVQMALERNNRASPYVAEAKDLNAKAQKAKTPGELLKIAGIRGALLTAAGISDKAAGHIDERGQTEAILGLVQTYLEPAGSSFREELVYRFLLTRGDTLGGSMRNVVGSLAQRRFTSMLLARLRNAGTSYLYSALNSKKWIPHGQEPTTAILETIKSVSWKNRQGSRVMSYNLKVPVVDKSVDMNLMACDPHSYSKATLGDPARFLALGELKGGIDPAGADEHWKTANSALDRIRKAFTAHRKTPFLFFVGAAIEQSMAKEIWKHLEDGSLSNAANLTVDAHLTALCDWLVGI